MTAREDSNLSEIGTAFGIFVFKNHNQLPPELKPVKIARDYVITSLEDNGLYFAYRVAKLVIEAERSKVEGKIPVVKIETEIKRLLESSKDIGEAIKKASTISSAGEYIRSTLASLRLK